MYKNSDIEPKNPKHVAIIMDGNGRWAKQRSMIRTAGHKEGLETAKKTVKAASDFGIEYITLYVFSSENWKRAESEVGFLMKLIEKHLLAEFEFYKANNIRILHIGDMESLPASVQRAIKTAVAETAHFTGTSAVLAINYGGQDEIFRAVKKYCDRLLYERFTGYLAHSANKSADQGISFEEFQRIIQAECPPAASVLSQKNFEEKLDTAGIPPVDLLIRTGGEKRLSNFLLYQSAYAELYFSDKLWPDWTKDDFKAALDAYRKRDRRFGNAQ